MAVYHTTGQRRNSLFTLCVLTQQLSPHRTASHRAAPRCTAPHRIVVDVWLMLGDFFQLECNFDASSEQLLNNFQEFLTAVG